MAKGNLILGTARGKLGDTVLFRQDGQQRSRVRVREIGNPKTQPQAVNRALLNTLSAAYAYMKGIVDHSFQGLAKPVENQRKFAKLNQGIARETGSVAVPGTDSGYNFNFKGESLLRPNPYAISRGTMPGVEVYNIANEGGLIDGFQFNQALTALLDVNTTYTQFCAAIGVEVGTQLTFCIINDDTFTGEPSESNMPKAYGNFHFARIILSDDAGEGDVPMFVSSSGDMSINPAYANSRNQGTLFFDRQGETTVRIVVNGYNYPLAMGIIVSNYSSRMWLRSNCDMVVAEGYQDSNTMSEVYASYMQSETTPNSDLYLNQGEGTSVLPNPSTNQPYMIFDAETETVYYPADQTPNVTQGASFCIVAPNKSIRNVTGATMQVSGLSDAQTAGESIKQYSSAHGGLIGETTVDTMIGALAGARNIGYYIGEVSSTATEITFTVGVNIYTVACRS
jgi:hypothetical protein